MKQNLAKRILPTSLLTLLLTSCSLFYGASGEENHFSFAYRKRDKQAYVYEYDCQMDNNTEIRIPDTVLGYTVTALGGYYGRGYPEPFGVSNLPMEKVSGLDLTNMTASGLGGDVDEAIKDVDQVFDINFHLYFGKNIKSIYTYPEMINYEKDDKRYLFVVRYSVECSSDNPVFYSEEGKLYRKAQQQLVEDFLYF